MFLQSITFIMCDQIPKYRRSSVVAVMAKSAVDLAESAPLQRSPRQRHKRDTLFRIFTSAHRSSPSFGA
jgi:hypothetical protein